MPIINKYDDPPPIEESTRRDLILGSAIPLAFGGILAFFLLRFLWGRFSGAGAWVALGFLALCEFVICRVAWRNIRELLRRRHSSHDDTTA
jgi:hypothetical protein